MGFIGAWRNLAPMGTKLIAMLRGCNGRQSISSFTARQAIPQGKKLSNAGRFIFASSVKRDSSVDTVGNEDSTCHSSTSNCELSDVVPMKVKDVAATVEMIQLTEKQIREANRLLAQFDAKYREILSDQKSTRDTFRQLRDTTLYFRKAELIDQLDQLTQRLTKGLKIAEVGEKSTVLLSLRDEPCEESIESLECELVSEIRGTTVRGSVERKGNNQYEISYQPTINGRHQLHIKVNDQPIIGSPFTVRVKLPIEKLGTPISTIHGLEYPSGVAVNQSGEVIIADVEKHCISIFNSRGEKLRSFGRHGSHDGEFNSPCDVAVDNEGNILVADDHDRIQMFTSGGQFLSCSQLMGVYPNRIAFNPSNDKVYVTECEGLNVWILDSDLSLSSHFRYCTPLGPSDIACDSTGKVYVAETVYDHIGVFTAEGDKVRRIDVKTSTSHGCLTGVTVDTNGVVYVTRGVGDEGSDVLVFTSEGEHLTSFGGEGSAPYFSHPAVDISGVLYVCDTENNVVHLF